MHVLAELRNPLFDAPDRQRALRALQMSRVIRETNNTKAWQAVKNMIDKAVAEHHSSPRSKSQNSSAYAASPVPQTSRTQVGTPTNNDMRIYPALDAIPSYAYNRAPANFAQQALPTQQQPQTLPQEVFSTMQPLQNQSAPCWDDININNIYNIVGDVHDVQPTPGIVPDYDFVSIQ